MIYYNPTFACLFMESRRRLDREHTKPSPFKLAVAYWNFSHGLYNHIMLILFLLILITMNGIKIRHVEGAGA